MPCCVHAYSARLGAAGVCGCVWLPYVAPVPVPVPIPVRVSVPVDEHLCARLSVLCPSLWLWLRLCL